MDAQVATHEHAHPGPALYLRIAVILFVMTALEVLAFEVSHRTGWPLHALVEPLLNPILVILSAAKFALVAMFYMHLKSDGKLLSGIFVFPILLAIALVLALIALFSVVFLLVKR